MQQNTLPETYQNQYSHTRPLDEVPLGFPAPSRPGARLDPARRHLVWVSWGPYIRGGCVYCASPVLSIGAQRNLWSDSNWVSHLSNAGWGPGMFVERKLDIDKRCWININTRHGSRREQTIRQHGFVCVSDRCYQRHNEVLILWYNMLTYALML